MSAPRTLVAGVGNIFFSDDGFGVEVVHALVGYPEVNGIKVADYGIRSMHLAYEMIAGYDVVIIVDAVHRDGEPGTIYMLEPSTTRVTSRTPDAHSMELEQVFAMAGALGEPLPKTIVIGCEPACINEGIGLSGVVQQAVPVAATLIANLITRHGKRIAGTPATTEAQT